MLEVKPADEHGRAATGSS